jgi:ubiquinone/menaquinone biosynthesis C-methylase UbiE
MTRDDREFFRERYQSDRSTVARRIEQLALGHEVGVNGYTTVAEAQKLTDRLNPTDGHVLLDLGTGRGWPGSHIARVTGCRVIACDTPREALSEARCTLNHPDAHPTCGAVGASGLALPFPDGTFDSVSHADVFC